MTRSLNRARKPRAWGGGLTPPLDGPHRDKGDKPRIDPLCGEVELGTVLVNTLEYNSQTGQLDRIVVTATRPGYRVCVTRGCASGYYSPFDTYNLIQTMGFPVAAEVFRVEDARNVAKAIEEEFEDPCLNYGEDPSTYTARAQIACVGYVLERMPWWTYFAKGTAAIGACQIREANQYDKAANPKQEYYCKAP